MHPLLHRHCLRKAGILSIVVYSDSVSLSSAIIYSFNRLTKLINYMLNSIFNNGGCVNFAYDFAFCQQRAQPSLFFVLSARWHACAWSRSLQRTADFNVIADQSKIIVETCKSVRPLLMRLLSVRPSYGHLFTSFYVIETYIRFISRHS